MNIFKVLSRGHGNISETNISAYLGYLLDPSEDHGFQDFFLKKFLAGTIDKKEKISEILGTKISQKDFTINDLVLNKDFFVEVIYEKAFTNVDEINIDNIAGVTDVKNVIKKFKEKQIVDIVIILYKRNDDDQQEVFLSKVPVAAILIEIKTKANPTPWQMLVQNIYTVESLKRNEQLENLKKVYSIYLTAAGEKYKNEWESWSNKIIQYTNENLQKELIITGEHLIWTGQNKESSSDENINELIEKFPELPPMKESKSTTVTGILKRLLDKENSGDFDPCPDYTRHTIKAFINFIENDFNSEKASVIKRIQNNEISRFEFYRTILENEYKSRNELKKIADIENLLKEELVTQNMNYTFGNVPMMIFYPQETSKKYFFRIEFRRNGYSFLFYSKISSEIIGDIDLSPVSVRSNFVKGVLERDFNDNDKVTILDLAKKSFDLM